ncbi:BnaA09g46680D [Brassica napus]|uniref:BnaA09g46680D protein n=1 Tax=Brassica napus TaxID=3708 RepID=A0A078GN13_BRANA|nr:BnaA09g46680D [Brassica napus]
MAEETVRIRLVFENQRILSKHQKKQGLKRSWAVLNPKYHRTVSEFSNHILYTFSLFEACPHGLSLYMDGFVLPPFESSCVLKDKDIVCVKRKKEPLLEIVEEDSDENVCAAIDIEERAQVLPDAMLIGNEETGGYESESEEEEEVVPEKKTSKKRKACSKSLSSKRKKCKLATTEETPLEREDAAVVNKSNDVKKKKRKTLDVQRDENDEQNDANAKSMTMTKSKKSSLQEESNEPDELSNISAETIKTPSRSARRKKAKRQWLREKTKQEKEELQQNQMQMVVAPSKKPAITIDHQETEENHSEALEKQQPDEQVDGVRDEVVVPVEVRPGHIRFKPLDESDEAFPETEPPAESFLWNGNMTKKKGQKWGTEKTGFSKRYAWDLNDTYHQTQPAEAETLANGQIDYEQLVAYTGSVKKGDIIAYRLIELTSSWTPEVSSFRVGKISYYDPVSKMVTLMPVQGYPIEKKIEEDDDSSMQADTSLYNEDGSLEVEFSSLLDVRSVKTSSSDVVEVATKPDQAATNLKLSTNSNGLQTTVKENGKGNPWEELSEAVSAKKAKLSEANNGWNKKGKSSSGGSWRRGGGIGPLMNYLRSQKEI